MNRSRFMWLVLALVMASALALSIFNTPTLADSPENTTGDNVTDTFPPMIFLEYPPANHSTINNSITFFYYVTDIHSGIENCSFLVDGSINLTDSQTEENSTQNFTQTFQEGVYGWSVMCHDDSPLHNSNTSEQRELVIDNSPPFINLESPFDEERIYTNDVTFYYNVTDLSGITECSLFIDDKLTLTNKSIQKEVSQSFNHELKDGNYTWHISCVDEHGYEDISQEYVLWVGDTIPLEGLLKGPTSDISFNSINIDQNISLNIGSTKTVFCNFTVHDVDSAANILGANATFFHGSVSYDSPDSNSTHYSNSSCTNISQTANNKTFECTFKLWYYAKDGGWSCRPQVWDNETNLTSTNATAVNPLYAFNVTPAYLSYGTLEAGQNSTTDTTLAIENLGNMEIDVAVDGYAQFDGDGDAMVCTNGSADLSYERYSLNSDIAYSDMTFLTDEGVQLDNFNLVPKNDTFSGSKNIYWKMGLPKPVKGTCSGFVTVAVVPS